MDAGERTEVLAQPLPLKILLGVFAGGGSIAILSTPFIQPVDAPSSVALVIMGALCTGVAVRGWRCGAVLHPDRILVRGLVYSRTIPRGAITGVVDSGYVEWKDESGIPRETPVTGLMSNDPIRRRTAMQLVRAWSTSGMLPSDTGP